MSLDWTAVIVAIVALLGTTGTALSARKRSNKPTLIDQAGQVSTMAVEQMTRMAEEIAELEEELEKLRSRVTRQGSRIWALEQALRTAGIDPGTIKNGNGST